MADEESFQRILNRGLSQRLQQGEWRDKKILNGGFWILGSESILDRIYRKGGEEKAETGDWRPERKGRATGEGRGDFEFWMVDWQMKDHFNES